MKRDGGENRVAEEEEEEKKQRKRKIMATQMMMKMWRRSRLLLEVNLMFELHQTEELLAAQSPSDTSGVSIATQ